MLENVSFRELGEVVTVDKVKVVACDGRGNSPFFIVVMLTVLVTYFTDCKVLQTFCFIAADRHKKKFVLLLLGM